MLLKRRSVARSLGDLKSNLLNKTVANNHQWNDFIFLCGATGKTKGTTSFRRQAVTKFIESNVPNSKVLLAENVFEVLNHEKHVENLLDIESLISVFADHVVIILESNSTFCELGAFSATEEIRNKIIVINDEAHKNAPSFINLGPLKAIQELKGGDEKVLLYKMDNGSTLVGPDSIGTVFPQLHSKLVNTVRVPPVRRFPSIEELNPADGLSKERLMFINDLIFFASPISYPELVEIVKFLFGDDKSYDDLKKYLGLLTAANEIFRDKDFKIYKTNRLTTLFEYNISTMLALQSAFKVTYFRHSPEKIKCQLGL